MIESKFDTAKEQRLGTISSKTTGGLQLTRL